MKPFLKRLHIFSKKIYFGVYFSVISFLRDSSPSLAISLPPKPKEMPPAIAHITTIPKKTV